METMGKVRPTVQKHTQGSQKEVLKQRQILSSLQCKIQLTERMEDSFLTAVKWRGDRKA